MNGKSLRYIRGMPFMVPVTPLVGDRFRRVDQPADSLRPEMSGGASSNLLALVTRPIGGKRRGVQEKPQASTVKTKNKMPGNRGLGTRG